MMSKVDEVKGLSVWALATMADCGDPDNNESPGAMLLREVRDSVVDRYEYGITDADEAAHEIADGAPSVYTHRKWLQFVDLQAYREDPREEFGWQGEDMDQGASLCVYMIAYRLASVLIRELGVGRWELDEEESDDE